MKKDFRSRLKNQLQTEALELLEKLALIADEHNQRLFLVGGIVRDLLLQRENLDLDIAIEGNAIELAHKFSGNMHLHLVKHDRFGTATLSYHNLTIDIVSARRESYRHPGALPEVVRGSIFDDLYRRDFTINAMAIALNKADYGELIDPHHGSRDIQNKLIRVIHPASFRDDATRMFRALRYEQRLNFALESGTEQLLRQNVKILSTISPARIKNEFKLIFKEELPERTISRAQELGILHQIHPALGVNYYIAKYYEQARLWAKSNNLSQIYFNLLILTLNHEVLKELSKRINPTKKELANLEQTLLLKSKLEILGSKNIKPSRIHELLRPFNDVAIITNMIASDSAGIKHNLRYYLTEMRSIKPLLSGRQLKEMGISEGPRIGEIMENLLAARLDGKVTTISDEVQLFNRLIKNKRPVSRK